MASVAKDFLVIEELRGEDLTEVKFVGGIDGKKKWLDNGKKLSRNYKQGNRVYDSEGIATTLTSQPVGGTGGYTSLYLIDEDRSEARELSIDNKENTSTKPFTFVELFAGIGGVSFGLEQVGGKCVLAAEYDPQMKTQFAHESYKVLHPEVNVRYDVHDIDEKEVPDHDVLAFTPPCQSFSVAGKRGGFDDTRGTLVFEALRIAKHKQPKILLMENVKGLVSHDKGRTLDTIVKAINDIGYTIDFEVLNSKYFGVPQNRERIFIVAIRDDLVETENWEIEGTTVVPKGKRRISSYEGIKTFNFEWPEQQEITTRLRDILEDSVDEKYYLSDEKTEILISELESKDCIVGSVGHHPFSKKYEFNGYNSTVSPSLIATDYKAPKTILEEDIKSIIRKTRPNEEVSINFKDNGDIRPHRNDAKKSGISELNINHEDNTSFTVTSTHAPKVYGEKTKCRIRKLTPLECFRLQGFSDEDHQKLVDTGVSDSQRYKQAGNAVTVNVVKAIGEKLLKYL